MADLWRRNPSLAITLHYRTVGQLAMQREEDPLIAALREEIERLEHQVAALERANKALKGKPWARAPATKTRFR